MVAAACSQREIKSAPGTAVYRRRQPERSTVYQVMQGHLETWLAGCRQADGEGLPVAGYIEEDFRKYLAFDIWPMVLLEPDVPVAVTISLSRSPVKGVVFVPPAIPGGW